jgi:adenosylcobinamide-phosphate synthase
MNSLLEHTYANGALLVMWGALLFHLILPIPNSAHPVTAWQYIAKRLAQKVNTSGDFQQSKLSGSLALIVLMTPVIILLVAFRPLVWQPQLYDLGLLLLSLDWRNNERLTRQLVDALSQDDKKLARQVLGKRLNRETGTLSLIGLGKAGAETIIMGYTRNVICVLFWYGVLGGIGALCYRLIAELARAWSPAQQKFHPFGLFTVKLLAALDLLPMRLYALFISIGKNTASVLATIKQQAHSWPLPGPSWVLISVGCKSELALGGPAIYDGTKQERARIGGNVVPSAYHLMCVQKLLAWRIYAWLMLQSSIMLLVYQGV